MVIYARCSDSFGQLSIMLLNDENIVYPIIPETLSQFTGLHDKNGKEIYEGDILRTKHDDEFIVYFDNLGWRILLNTNYENMSTKLSQEDKEHEVIGNIFVNPELNKNGLQLY